MAEAARHLCPICGRDAPSRSPPASSQGKGNPSFPFCSPPCKLVDLGRWLDGGYAIPGPPVGLDEDRDGDEG
jgi:endogenous inhibitor of DNA gyrase (YacG/DUF329 family)